MMGIVRVAQPLSALCVLVLVAACLGPAGAQSTGMQPVTDAKGLFTISIPSDWRVATSRMSDVLFQGLRTSGAGQYVTSTLAAHSLDEAGPLGVLAVAALDLPRRISPGEFAEGVKEFVPAQWSITQEGRATIAGRDAHYIYFAATEHEFALYMVMAYFNVGRMGFLVIGGTMNEPGAIRKHFATISRVLETFHPSPKLGASLRTTLELPR